jgi:DeoR family transcriptional regulator, aga operon transcriptional repressor
MKSIAERHKYILDTLSKEGFVRVIDAAKHLDVTTVTIRKDLKILEERGLLYRTHGSASPVNPHMKDRAVTEKEKLFPEEKTRIAIEAAKLIEDDDYIIINSGSTICAFAEHLQAKGRLTVVSASIKATQLLSSKENVNVIQLGGTLRKRSMSVVGNFAETILEDIACSKLFLGVDGVDPEFGVTNSNIDEAELNRVMMNSALKTIVLCDSSKFGRKGFGKVCSLDKIDVIITDASVPETIAKDIEELGVEIIIAK